MRNSASRHSFVMLTAVAVWLSVSAVTAQAQTARARYVAAVEKDEKVRVQLTDFKDKTPPADLMTQVTQVMTSFEAIVRRFPTSGYADDALYQAASLADAVWMASTVPAKVLDLAQEKGRIAPGYDADLVALDTDLIVVMTWARGRLVYART